MSYITRNTCHAQAAPVADTFAPFDPRAYLKEYYSHLGEENQELLHFIDDVYRRIFVELDAARLLEFGGGPTIYQLISAAKYPVSIDFSDYLDANLNEVHNWLQDKPEQFFWDDFIRYVLKLEGECGNLPTVKERVQLIRHKIKRLIHCDAKKSEPLELGYRAPYDIVSINFVLESITTGMSEWNVLIENVLPLVRPQGYLLMCAITGATCYRVGERFFPAVSISPEILESKLKQQQFSIIHTHAIEAEHKDEQGYDGIAMVLARKGQC